MARPRLTRKVVLGLSRLAGEGQALIDVIDFGGKSLEHGDDEFRSAVDWVKKLVEHYHTTHPPRQLKSNEALKLPPCKGPSPLCDDLPPNY